MKQIKIILLIIPLAGLIFSCKPRDISQDITIVKYEELEKSFTAKDDILYVVNFWATWCAPCVKELPEFMLINKEFIKNQKFKMILVSLDDVELIEEVKKKNSELKLNVKHYLLDDVKRMNTWIPAVDLSWSGAIPATLFIKNGEKLEFVSNPLTQEELKNIITKYL